MSNGASPPVARVVTLSGGDLAVRAVVEAVRDEIAPRLDEVPGFLGMYGLLDPVGNVGHSVQLWRDQVAFDESAAAVESVNDAVSQLANAVEITTRRYELVYHHPHPDVHGLRPSWETHPAARLVTVEGGDLTDPEVLETMVTYQATYLPSVPGCLSALLLLDRERPTLLGLSVWTDATSAERTVEKTAQLARDIAAATHGVTGSAHVYQLMVSVPMIQSYLQR